MSKFRAKKLAYKKKKKLENKYNLTERQERIFLEKAVQIFIDYKKTPDGGTFLKGDSCVSHSQLFYLFLKKLGFNSSKVICVDVASWNRDYVAWYNAGNGYETTSDGYICEGFPNAYIGLCGHMDGWDFQNDLEGYAGHVIVQTKHHFVDLTFGQFSRPDNDINVPPMMIMPRTIFRTRKEQEKANMIPPFMIQMNDSHIKAKSWKETETNKRLLEKEQHSWSGFKSNSRIALLPLYTIPNCSGNVIYITRPDQKISENYPRWNKKSFTVTNDRITEVLLSIYNGKKMDIKDRIKVYEETGHITIDVSEDE